LFQERGDGDSAGVWVVHASRDIPAKRQGLGNLLPSWKGHRKDQHKGWAVKKPGMTRFAYGGLMAILCHPNVESLFKNNCIFEI
jgi:hypothetical protein